jgi:hypothetical protein
MDDREFIQTYDSRYPLVFGNRKNIDRQLSCTTFSPSRWAKWRMLRVWSP